MPLFRNFEYKRLKRHPGIWRVDGIGQVSQRAKLGAAVEVIFSPIRGSFLSDPYHPEARTDDSSLMLRVHSAGLRYFVPGTVWRDGKRILSPKVYGSPFLVDVQGNVETFIGWHTKFDGGRFNDIIPEDQYRLGNGRSLLAATPFMVVKVINDPRADILIIPSSEILRLYFGPSSRMISAVLRGTLDDLVDWQKSFFEDSVVSLSERRPINQAEQIAFARAKCSSTAESALFGVHQHLAGNSLNNKTQRHTLPLNVKATFPFSDQTTLSVSGIKLELSGKQRAILVTSLLVCSHPLGFSSIEVISQSSREGKGSRAGDGCYLPPSLNPDFDDRLDESDLLDESPDRRIRRLAILELSNHFPAARSIRFRRHNGGHPTRWRPTTKEEIGSLSVEGGTSAGGKGIGGTDTYDHLLDLVARDLTLFIEALKHLQLLAQSLGLDISTRKVEAGLLSEKDHISSFPWKTEKRRRWHLISDVEGARPRQVVFVEIQRTDDGAFFYLAEMELRPGENGQCTILLHHNDGRRLEDPAFEDFLFLTSIQRKWVDHGDKWEKDSHRRRAARFLQGIVITRIKHPNSPKASDDMDAFTCHWGHQLYEAIEAPISAFR